MANITYYFGAGASRNALPIVDEMAPRIRLYQNFLRMINKDEKYSNEDFTSLINYYDELLLELNRSTSIDAYARELGNSRNFDKLKRLKAALISYLLFEQLNKEEYALTDITTDIIREKTENENEKKLFDSIRIDIDKRYRTFWGEITQRNENRIKKGINIISWNYDMQLETSYCRFNDKSLREAQLDLDLIRPNFQTGFPMVIKINGTAGLYDNGTNPDYLIDFTNSSLEQSILKLSFPFKFIKSNDFRVQFYFSWENNSISNTAITNAEKVLQGTEILVAIGYSFPSYNKEIDKRILGNCEKLGKIYLQTSDSTKDEIIERLIGINPKFANLIHHKNKLDTFFIPPEME